jgi:hypothetical protein
VYGIHSNHDHIDEGERVKGDRGWKNGERWEKMRETGDKGKKEEKGERKEKRALVSISNILFNIKSPLNF